MKPDSGTGKRDGGLFPGLSCGTLWLWFALVWTGCAIGADVETVGWHENGRIVLPVIRFDPADKESKLRGLMPVGWYPGTVCFDAQRKQFCVANIKSIAEGPSPKGFNSRQFQGTVSLVPLAGTTPRRAAVRQIATTTTRRTGTTTFASAL